jgi:hypothetical protein
MASSGSDYRSYIHAEGLVDRVTAEAGLVPVRKRSSWIWNVWLYSRA